MKLKDIKIGEHYYGGDGRKWRVLAIAPGDQYDVVGVPEGVSSAGWWDYLELPDALALWKPLRHTWLSVEKPDTWERIIYDAVSAGQSPMEVPAHIYHGLVARCKRLAGDTRGS